MNQEAVDRMTKKENDRNYLKLQLEAQINEKYRRIENAVASKKDEKCDLTIVDKTWTEPSNSLRRKIRVSVDDNNKKLLSIKPKYLVGQSPEVNGQPG
jgi:tRNA/tmRNA/rRNA uracil-C5-methylase (TrmA/RlmC/RlmD family)